MKLNLCLVSVIFPILISIPSALSARQVTFDAEPAGTVMNVLQGHPSFVGNRVSTPGSLVLRSNRDPYIFEFSHPGYESKVVTYDYRSSREITSIRVNLQPLVQERKYFISSEPEGADVLLDGRSLGVTPLHANLRFERQSSNHPWSQNQLQIRMDGYQSQSRVIELHTSDILPTFRLARVSLSRSFTIKSTTEDGQELAATIEVNGNVVGTAPQKLDLSFNRANAESEWNRYQVRVFIENEFLPKAFDLGYNSDMPDTVVLQPVTEVPVVRYFPTVEVTARGPRAVVDMSAPVGKLDTRDINSPAFDLRPVTNFARAQQVLQSVNSFCLTPDGQQLIYAVSMMSEEGSPYSSLYIKSSSDQSFAFQQLTRGSRFMDTRPTMSREEDSTLVVFQSNRGPVDSWDISSFHLRDGRIVGGIQQLTRDARLNYGPVLISEALPVYFSSSETFPNARPFISHTRIDGSTFTNLGEEGRMLSCSDDGMIYFVRTAEDTGKQQIYSVTSEGFSFSSVITDVQFAQANVHSPNISPDGNLLLFVSDYSGDDKERGNNNIYIFNRSTSRIQQITDNGSDDVHPVWSPTEAAVLYFLSNRGGVYNIWRMRMVDFN